MATRAKRTELGALALCAGLIGLSCWGQGDQGGDNVDKFDKKYGSPKTDAHPKDAKEVPDAGGTADGGGGDGAPTEVGPGCSPVAADLVLSKRVDQPTPNVGDTVAFLVTLVDQGPGPATGVSVRDLLPAGLSFVSASPSQGTYTSATGVWSVGALANGASATLGIQARVVSPSSQTNTAVIISADQVDPNPGNNAASATETPQRADLQVGKSVSSPNPNVGDAITYTVTLSNNGPDPATGVTVQDVLPAGVSFQSAAPSAGSYTSANGLWSVGTVGVGVIQTLTIVAVVIQTGHTANAASVGHSDQFDPNPSNNTASTSMNPAAADLQLGKIVSDPRPNVGDTVSFTVTLTNSGPSSATDVQVTDLLPAGLSFVSATPSQGSYASSSGAWNVGSAAVGTPQSLVIQAVVVSPAPQTNTAVIGHSDQADPNLGNNSASATETPQLADLSLSKSVNNAAPNVGDTITFTVTLTNNGPDAATGVVLSDLLPPALTFVSAAPSQGSYASGSGLWTVGSVSAGALATLALQVTVVSPNAATNTAAVMRADQFDPNLANNTASATETPLTADLQLSKSVNNPTPRFGDTISFTVTLTNNGPSSASAVMVRDLLAADLTFISATASQGSYDRVAGIWDVGAVTVGAANTLVIQAQVACSTSLTNTAVVVHADQFDRDPANNSASVTLTPH